MPVPLLKVDALILFLNTEQKRGTTMTTEAPTMQISQMTTPEPGTESWAHSNSPENYKTFNIDPISPVLDLPEIHKVSWDKMAILGNLDPNRAQSLITNFCNEPNVIFQGAHSSRGFKVTIMDTVTCLFNMDGPSKNARNFKLEFNPNNTPKEFHLYYASVILPALTDVGFTRLDLAIDTTEDLGLYCMQTVNPTKSKAYFSRAGELETKYFGTRKGKNYIRIYDKNTELEESQGQEAELPELWRIEFEMKGPQVADTWTTCADKLLIHKLEFPESVSGVWQLACESVANNPEGMDKLTDYEKRKCRKILKESKGADLMPVVHQAIKLSEQRLQAELNEWMPGAL